MIKANWVVLEHVNTKVQIADIFTKAIVKSESWLQLTDLAQVRAAQSGKPPKIDLVKKPKKKNIDSDTSKEQVSPALRRSRLKIELLLPLFLLLLL